MEELHFVYINANGRIGVHSIQSISYSEIIYRAFVRTPIE